ncbi:calcium-binding protein, partial [Brevirhabdus pacifica]
MGWLTHIATFGTGGDLPHMEGITDLEIRQDETGAWLYSASGADDGLSVFSLGVGQVASYLEQRGAAANRGTDGLAGIELVEIGGQVALLPSGRLDDRMAFHYLDADGGLGGVRVLGADSSLIGNISESLSFSIAGKTFLVTTQWGDAGFRSYRLRDDYSVEYKNHFEGSARAATGDITAMASVEIDGRTFFFTASAEEDAVTAWWIGQWGNIKQRDTSGASEGLGIADPSALDTVVVGGTAFLVVGSAGSNTLTVLRVGRWGGLFEEDHVLDSLSTRFAGVTAVETFTIGDRAFVLAGGSDDGLTLFELAPDGQLLLIEVLADSAETTLSDISDIEVVVLDGEIQVYVASSDEAGITQFTLDPGNLGISVNGEKWAETLSGTDADDLLAGRGGNDTLLGGAGDDWLIDGTGADVMTGGAGADTFVFVDDGRMDTVTDFTPGEDRLDLSDFALLYSMDQLSLVQKDYGVLIEIGDDRIRLEGGIQIADLSAE